MVMADIHSGRMPHFHLDGFMQPALVENDNHVDFKFPPDGISE